MLIMHWIHCPHIPNSSDGFLVEPLLDGSAVWFEVKCDATVERYITGIPLLDKGLTTVSESVLNRRLKYKQRQT